MAALFHLLGLKRVFLTLFALMAFAANSVLCRMALGSDQGSDQGAGQIDAASFTMVRLLSGAVVLLLILAIASRKPAGRPAKGSWLSAAMLFLYATAFSYAYLSLDTGTGALVLFGAVQVTMITVSIFQGNRLQIPEWLGMLLAFSGLAYLVLPDISSPSFSGFMLMLVSGVAWGVYTLRGKASSYPLSDTAYNFLRTGPLLVLLAVFAMPALQLSAEGVMLAALSGGLASGIGYTVWYIALASLSTTEAAVVQLSVPAIAAIGGILFVHDAVSIRLMVSGVLILGGILMVTMGRYYARQAVK